MKEGDTPTTGEALWSCRTVKPTDPEFKEPMSAELSVNMGNGVFDDPLLAVGNTSRADPACATDDSVLLSGAIPGYSVKVGDTPTKWSSRTGQPVSWKSQRGG